MACIYKRKSRYNVIYYSKREDGTKKQVWEMCTSLEEALRRKEQVEFLQQHHLEKMPAILTVEDLLREFTSVYGIRNWAMSTYESKVGLINHYIIPTLGNVRLADLNPFQMDRYYLSLQNVRAVSSQFHHPKNEYISEHTIHEIWKILRQAFNKAVSWGYLEKNPAAGIRNYRKKKQAIEIWTAEEFFLAAEKSRDDLLSLSMHLSFSCTLRLGEILALCRKDIHLEHLPADNKAPYLTVSKELQRVNRDIMEKMNRRDVFTVFPPLIKGGATQLVLKRPKTESSIRTVYIPETVCCLLRKRLEEIDRDKEIMGADYSDYGLIFCNNIGRPIEASVIERAFQTLIRENHLRPVIFHSLRHTSITYKLKLTQGNMKAVQGDSGHSDFHMIEEIYSHILDEDRAETAKLLEREFYRRSPNSSETEDAGPYAETPREKETSGRARTSSLYHELKKVLSNPETQALLESFLSEIRKEGS